MSHLLLLILQIGVVLVTARAVGWIFRKLRQPQVVGEMAAGIVLGPSLLGWVAPGISERLFPPGSLGHLNTLSQVGLLLFMFLVGLEFDPKLLRGRGRAAIITSYASIAVPFVLSVALALYLFPRLSDESVSFTGFALFLGTAMSVTAFPVLARILTERNLLRTRVGSVTVACAAVADVTAWLILAVVVAIVRSDAVETPVWITLLGTAAYLGLMVTLVRRALGWVESFYHSRGRLTQDVVAAVLLFLLASAWVTEWLGIHALFGAFTLGAVMPKERGFVHDLSEKLEDVTVVFLLPLFFAHTGLRTSLGLIDGREMWMYTGILILVAVAGKFGGSALAARATGLSWREAGALGVLMNTRGLMELVILTIGLDLGVISPALFTMMVIVALTTTFMTTPLLEVVYPVTAIRESAAGEEIADQDYTVLIPVSLPSSGPGLLDAAISLVPEGRRLRLYALHLERIAERSMAHVDAEPLPADNEVLRPLLTHAELREVEVRPLAFASRDVSRDILDLAYVKGANLVLMGWHKPILGKSILGGTVGDVLAEATGDVAILVDRRRGEWRRILVPYRDAEHDAGALDVARRVAASTGAEVTILHVVTRQGPRNNWEEMTFPDGVRLKLVSDVSPLEAAVREAQLGYDLIVVGTSQAWGTMPTPFGQRHEALARASDASLLVVRVGAPAASGAEADGMPARAAS